MADDKKREQLIPAGIAAGAAGGGRGSLTSTRLTEDLATAEMKERYDAHCKRLLSHKPILARIMKGCMEEYRDCPAEEIESLIEGTPAVGSFPLHDGQSEIKEKPMSQGADVIHGQNTEDASPTDGTICYDIRFTALAPSTKEPIQLIINVEAQNRFKPGYPLIRRGVYYASRLISAQGRTEVKNERYDSLKKVYSVWICTVPPAEHDS
ncbi:MAG: Rpn family recombination-promoting nuclease/putative transposase [Treponema sp.]|nr:Rpn family recombination-promoting nuclease/putative transposase [Treponema sp.]